MIKTNFKIDFSSRAVEVISSILFFFTALVLVAYISRFLYLNFFHTSEEVQNVLDKKDKFSIEIINKDSLAVIDRYLRAKNNVEITPVGRNPFFKK